MLRVTIDNREVEVPPGSTILDAARKLDIHIPTMCFLEGHRANTSCFVCVVKVKRRASLLPACATAAEDGMEIESETPEVREARQTALELLLSDHLGDCVAPCQLACPAGMDIPRMIRQIAAGALGDAIRTVKENVALPALLGRLCAAPCEKACRRGDCDEPVAICRLQRYAADADLASPAPYLPACQPPRDKRVAIIGAGPAGLSAAYHLLRDGYPCTVFDDHPQPGGMLRYGVPEASLPRGVLDAEIQIIANMGAEFRMSVRVGDTLPLANVKRDFAAVLIATGAQENAGIAGGEARHEESTPGQASSEPEVGTPRRGVRERFGDLSLPMPVNHHTLETGETGVFAAGDAVRPHRLAMRAVGDGRAAAASIRQFLSGQPVAGLPRPFSTHYGRLDREELAVFIRGASPAPRIADAPDGRGLTADEARGECLRCLRCDCRKQTDCKLRNYSAAYAASAARYRAGRRPFDKHDQHGEIVFEPGKCIDCGLCIQIAAAAREPLGLTFIGRGFDVRVGVPFNASIAAALKNTAGACADACPTGAIARRDDALAAEAETT